MSSFFQDSASLEEYDENLKEHSFFHDQPPISDGEASALVLDTFDMMQ